MNVTSVHSGWWGGKEEGGGENWKQQGQSYNRHQQRHKGETWCGNRVGLLEDQLIAVRRNGL